MDNNLFLFTNIHFFFSAFKIKIHKNYHKNTFFMEKMQNSWQYDFHE